MSNKLPQELREQVRDRFAGLTGTYDGADAMADFTIDLLHSHMQAGFEYVIGNNERPHPDDGGWAKNEFREEQRKRAAKWLGGDK